MRITFITRLADRFEMINGSVVELTLTGLVNSENRSAAIYMIVDRQVEEEKVVLDAPMQSNCWDLYPE